MAEIDSLLFEIIADHLCCPIESVVPTADLVADLGADSLDAIELALIAAETFDIEIPDNSLDDGTRQGRNAADGFLRGRQYR
jgi:acyl carrier protein